VLCFIDEENENNLRHGEHVAEQRGRHWELTSFEVEVWDTEERVVRELGMVIGLVLSHLA
jgi:hypothetical protein